MKNLGNVISQIFCVQYQEKRLPPSMYALDYYLGNSNSPYQIESEWECKIIL